MSESTFTSTPAAPTLTNAQNDIARYVMYPNDTEVLDLARSGLLGGIGWLNTRAWNWALDYDDLDFVAGTDEYALSQSFKKPKVLNLLNASSRGVIDLRFEPWPIFVQRYSDRTTQGDPECYSLRNTDRDGFLTLGLQPTSIWVATYPHGRIHYHARIQEPSGVEAINVPQEVYRTFLLPYAKAYVADVMAQAKAAAPRAEAAAAMRKLISDDLNSLTDQDLR